MLIYTACLAALLSQTNSAQKAPNPIVTIETSMGQIKIELFEDKAPATVKNFLSYVDKKHYENTIFHRVIGTFMIQGGGHEPGMKERKTDAPIVNESNNGLSNVRGTIAMARTADADSARSQFFINVVDNTRLDRNKAFDGIGYCVFGKVIDGMDVIDKIKAVKVGDKAGHQNVPIEDVVIKSIKKSN